MIFIHGFGSTQYDWPLDLLESVSNERRVIIFDNPGIGMSNDTTTEPLTIDYMASATAGLIDALGLDRPDVVGYSMGGDIALTLATNYSDKVGGVVAVAGSFGGPAAPQPPAGLANVLYELEQVFLSKSQAYSAGAANITSSSAQNATADPMVLFFPLGSLDPGELMTLWVTHGCQLISVLCEIYKFFRNLSARVKKLFFFCLIFAAYCNMMRDFVSLLYATGMFPIDASAGYALPGGVYTSGIIPSRTALVPTQVAMDNQTAALMLYHTAESSVAEALPNATNQILYIAYVFLPQFTSVSNTFHLFSRIIQVIHR